MVLNFEFKNWSQSCASMKEYCVKGNNVLNYDITWTDAERVYSEVAKDTVMNRAFTGVFAQHNALRKDVEMLRRLVPAAR
jgi:hypothetical protein